MAKYIDAEAEIAYIKRVHCEKCNDGNGSKCCYCGIADALMVLEEADEADVVKLPCQVGDYISLQLHLGSTSLCRVNGFVFDNTEKTLRVCLDDVINLVNQHYGKNILTKEEAEKALERSEGK